MNKSSIRRVLAAMFALIVIIASAFYPVSAQAASLSSDVGKLERYTEQLERTIHSRQLSKPYALYNKTKRSYSETKQRIERLKDSLAKQQYRERLKKADRTIRQAAYYISAIESGERLISLKSRIDQSLISGKVEVVYDVYPSFDEQLKKTKVLIQKVSGSVVRQKMTETYVRPAETTKQRAFYPMNIMLAFDEIILAYEQDDIEKAERLLRLCEKWLPYVKDANAKTALNRYLADFEAPVILEVQ